MTDVSFEMIRQAIAEGTPNAAGEVLDPFARDGVCVGFAVYGAAVAIAPLLQDGSVADELTHEPGVTGEILVSAPHVKDRYDTLWVTEEQSISTPGWHHTGDVGHLDASGRLWVEGRLAHVLLTSQGVLTPVAAEQSAESLPEVRRAALAGGGPAGTAAPVLVIEASANTAALEARQSASGLKRALLDRVPGTRRFPIAEAWRPLSSRSWCVRRLPRIPAWSLPRCWWCTSIRPIFAIIRRLTAPPWVSGRRRSLRGRKRLPDL